MVCVGTYLLDDSRLNGGPDGNHTSPGFEMWRGTCFSMRFVSAGNDKQISWVAHSRASTYLFYAVSIKYWITLQGACYEAVNSVYYTRSHANFLIIRWGKNLATLHLSMRLPTPSLKLNHSLEPKGWMFKRNVLNKKKLITGMI